MARKRITPTSDMPRLEEASKPIPMPIPGNLPLLNTVTLSSDMTTLFLIEGSRVIPYSLYSIGGVLIGLVGGQITVVSALDPQPDPGNSTSSVATRSAAVPIPVVKAIKVSTERTQWSLLFVPRRGRISIIGATDIDASLRENDDLGFEGYAFDLREGYLNIRRSGNTLIAVLVPMSA